MKRKRFHFTLILSQNYKKENNNLEFGSVEIFILKKFKNSTPLQSAKYDRGSTCVIRTLVLSR